MHDDTIQNIISHRSTTAGNMHIPAVKSRPRREGLFRALYEWYKEPLGRKLFFLVYDMQVTEELYQEVFIRVWKRLEELQPIEHFEPWLYRIARNLAIDYLRHKMKLQFSAFPEEGSTNAESFPLLQSLSDPGHEERVCEAECLRQALSFMSPQYRICLLLQDLWGYTQREIAVALEISEKSVSTNVSRGREQLRAAYCQVANNPQSVRKERYL